MSTLKVTNIQNPSTSSGGVSIDTSGHVTVDSVAMPSSGPLSNRNKIINGDMRIDQRYGGTAFTPGSPSSNTYTVDRWQLTQELGSSWTFQQNRNGVTPPAGFSNYLGITVNSASTPTSGSYNAWRQAIEGYNASDLAWGTADAKSVAVSFWVRSSLTGQFSGSLRNGAATFVSYPFTYTINSANTWQYVTLTIPGPTTGTWNTLSSSGIEVFFDLGCGSSNRGTAGSWATQNVLGATGSVNLISTAGATFYITGVQLEAGSVATPFEHRSYGDEMRRCQRYFWAPIKDGSNTLGVAFGGGGTNAIYHPVVFPVQMRAAPTVFITSAVCADNNGGVVYYSSHSLAFPTTSSVQNMITMGATVIVHQPYHIRGTGATSEYSFNAEL
jgi:hypothetical protein